MPSPSFLPYGNMAFNSFGPRNELFEQSMKDALPVSEWIMAQCRREALRPGGFGAQIYAAVDAGTIGEIDAALLTRSLLPSVHCGVAAVLPGDFSFPTVSRLCRTGWIRRPPR